MFYKIKIISVKYFFFLNLVYNFIFYADTSQFLGTWEKFSVVRRRSRHARASLLFIFMFFTASNQQLRFPYTAMLGGLLSRKTKIRILDGPPFQFQQPNNIDGYHSSAHVYFQEPGYLCYRLNKKIQNRTVGRYPGFQHVYMGSSEFAGVKKLDFNQFSYVIFPLFIA